MDGWGGFGGEGKEVDGKRDMESERQRNMRGADRGRVGNEEEKMDLEGKSKVRRNRIDLLMWDNFKVDFCPIN